jgi:hypothetical protein
VAGGENVFVRRELKRLKSFWFQNEHRGAGSVRKDHGWQISVMGSWSQKPGEDAMSGTKKLVGIRNWAATCVK